MRNAGLEEAQAGIKIAGRNISNLRYADDTTLMAESKEELKSLLMNVNVESEKVGLKLNIQKTKIMASGPITSWEIDGETVKTVADLIFWGSKITAERLHFHFSLSWIGEGNSNPLQCSCLENPRDGGAWWAPVYGVAQSRTWLNLLSSSSRARLPLHIYNLAEQTRTHAWWNLQSSLESAAHEGQLRNESLWGGADNMSGEELPTWKLQPEPFSSFLLFSRSVVSDSLQPGGLQHARPPCPPPTPGACSDSCPSSQWCHPTISSSVVPLILPSNFPSNRVFSNVWALHIRWPKYWSISISPSKEYSELISFTFS